MLKQRAISAVLWSGSDIFLRQGLSFFVSVLLARLITPEEFGTIALLYIFTGLAGLFVDSGFSDALIQKKDINHIDESTVFWFNLGIGIVMSMVLWFSAPWIAHFFENEIVTPLAKVLAVNIFISALGSIHTSLMAKRLEFKTPLKIGAISTMVSGVVGVVMAWLGYGVWALIAQTLLSTFITTTLLWLLNPWRPRSEFSYISLKKLFRFGGFLLLSGLLDTIYNRMYSVLIGKLYGVRELGFYNRADSTRQLPSNILTSMLSRVAFPIFSAASHDRNMLNRGLRMAVSGTMLINVPMMLGLLVVAESLVPVVFGAQWLDSVPILQVLCLAGILWPLHILNLNVLMAQGHSGLLFKLEIVKKVFGIGLLILGTSFGVMGIAWSRVIYSAIAFGINAHYTRVHLGYGIWRQFLDFLPSLILSIIMAMLVYGVGELVIWSLSMKLLLQILVGVGLFLFGCYIFRLQAFQNVKNLLKPYLSK